jgi:uncharacterized protein YgiM (DUF1202 family)
MSIFKVSLQAVIISILLAGCNFPGLSPTPAVEVQPTIRPTLTEAGPPTQRPTQTEPALITPIITTPPLHATATTSPCTLSVTGDVPVYLRPSTESDVFGTLSAGMSVEALARTADGWIGFEPGVAQAANTGIFRLRWVQEGGNVSLTGSCADLPIVEGPPVGICFDMPMGDTPVYEEPNPASNLLTTLTPPQYTAVIGRNPANWYRVDLAIGNTSSNRAGWVEATTINLNGPCNALPVINIPAGQIFTPTGSNCTLTANADITATLRPFSISDTFGTLGSGMSVPVSARTPNGWIGFEPGVAQAANVDIFRLRWVNPDAAFTLTGSCAGLPTVIGPPPFVCFDMAQEDTTVFAETSTSSTVLATLLAEEYAAVTASTSSGWYRVDLDFGNSTSNEAGWIQATAINFNGHCDQVPVVAP